MTKIATPDTYETARAELDALEAEATGIDATIARATHAGDEGALPRHWARKAVLPALIAQARDRLLPLDRDRVEAAIATEVAAGAGLAGELQTATERLTAAGNERNQIAERLHAHNQRRQELALELRTIERQLKRSSEA